MDFRDEPSDAEFRQQVGAWLAEAVAEVGPAPSGGFEERLPHFRAWQSKLFEAGYAGLSWAAEYGGRELSLVQQAIFREEADRAGAPDRLNTIGEDFAGPTIIDHGSQEQRQRLLRPILTGEEIWCQLFSEPGAGSDLAALETKAERDGDVWRLSGQKVWTSRAQIADWAICLARTGPDRHRGIIYFLLPMRQEGVSVMPLRHMLGEPEFNEVFLDGAVVPDEMRLGPVDGGWRLAMATLQYERLALATGRVNIQRLISQLIEELKDARDTHGNPLTADPSVRRRAAAIIGRSAIHRINAMRAIASMSTGAPGPGVSIGKLLSAPLVEEIADLGVEAQGLAGQLDPSAGREAGRGPWLELSYQSRGTSIAGGTTFIQRNIVAERVLGLPRS